MCVGEFIFSSKTTTCCCCEYFLSVFFPSSLIYLCQNNFNNLSAKLCFCCEKCSWSASTRMAMGYVLPRAVCTYFWQVSAFLKKTVPGNLRKILQTLLKILNRIWKTIIFVLGSGVHWISQYTIHRIFVFCTPQLWCFQSLPRPLTMPFRKTLCPKKYPNRSPVPKPFFF